MAIASATDDRITVVTRDKGQKGDTGEAGIDGQGFNGVRQSLLDAPLCRLFTPNKLVDTLAGSLTATRATTATYVDRYGVVKTAAIDEMREESEGWLIEGASTNLLTYSEQFDNAAWETISATITPNAVNAPDNSATADEINLPQSSFLAQIITLTVDQQYTISVWVKSATATDQEFRLYGCDNIIGTFTATQEWQRFSFSFTATSGNSHGLAAPLGGDCDIYAWGAQLEALPFATSYIPTTSAAATRAADLVSFNAENNAPNTQGAFSIAFTRKKLGALSTLPVISFRTNTSSASFSSSLAILDEGQTNILFRVANETGTISDVRSTVTTTEANSFIATSDSTTAALYKNGALSESSATSGVSLVLPSVVAINSATDLTANNFGYYSDFRIYDFALNADEAAYLAGVK